jgi:hypothetical protein
MPTALRGHGLNATFSRVPMVGAMPTALRGHGLNVTFFRVPCPPKTVGMAPKHCKFSLFLAL